MPLTPAVSASWRTAQPPGFAVDLVKRLKFPSDESPPHGVGYTLNLGPVTPGPADADRIISLAIDLPVGDGELSWRLRASPRPTAPPPAWVPDFVASFGGEQGLRDTLKAGRVGGVPPACLLSVRIDVPEGKFDCLVLPQTPPPEALFPTSLDGFAEEARLEQVGYRFDGGAHGIQEASITYYHDARVFQLQVRARTTLTAFDAAGRWLPVGHEVMDAVLPRFFTTREVTP
jgi:hypothetical protein